MATTLREYLREKFERACDSAEAAQKDGEITAMCLVSSRMAELHDTLMTDREFFEALTLCTAEQRKLVAAYIRAFVPLLEQVPLLIDRHSEVGRDQ